MNQPQKFIDPIGSGEYVDFRQHVGQLALLEPKKIERDVVTPQGPADAVVADVTFIDAPGGPEVNESAFVFTTAIKGKIEDHMGSMVLGRVIHAQSKAGRDYPDLEPASDQDKQYAGQYVANREQQRAAGQFQQPAQGQMPVPPEQAPQQPQGAPQGPPPGWGQGPAQPPAQPSPAPQQPPPGWPQQPQSQPPF